jgi:membrane protein implicated in regulation of membrane protease activity
MAMARFSVMYFGHFILFSVFFLLYALLLVGLIARVVKRTMADSRASQYSEPLG